MVRSLKNLEIYEHSKKLVLACYELTHNLSAEEKTNFAKYIRAAALSFHLNIAQGAFLKSKKRKKYFRKAKNALVIIDAAIEILIEVGFTTQKQVEKTLAISSGCYKLINE